MTLLQLLDRLDESIGRSDAISVLRGQLSFIREQAEALESAVDVTQTRIEELQSRIKQQKTRIGELEAQAKAKQPQAKGTNLENGPNKFMETLFRSGGSATSFDIQRALQLQSSLIEHHADILTDAGLIELIGVLPGGLTWSLTKEGRAYAAMHFAKQA